MRIAAVLSLPVVMACASVGPPGATEAPRATLYAQVPLACGLQAGVACSNVARLAVVALEAEAPGTRTFLRPDGTQLAVEHDGATPAAALVERLRGAGVAARLLDGDDARAAHDARAAASPPWLTPADLTREVEAQAGVFARRLAARSRAPEPQRSALAAALAPAVTHALLTGTANSSDERAALAAAAARVVADEHVQAMLLGFDSGLDERLPGDPDE